MSHIRAGFRLIPVIRATENQAIRNYSSFGSSKFLEDIPEINVKYEVTKDPVDWKYVERVLPPSLVPEPIKKDEYPSGWKPQGDGIKDRPYFVARTKNHMIPVYLRLSKRDQVRETILKNIQGDIWKLEEKLRPFLEKVIKPRPLRHQVDEFSGKIRISGDHVNAIKWWLTQQNL